MTRAMTRMTRRHRGPYVDAPHAIDVAGEVLDLDRIALGEQGGGAESVLELAHVTGPRVPGQPLERPGREAPGSGAALGGDAGEDGRRDQGQVAQALAQRRDLEHETAEAVVEVLA